MHIFVDVLLHTLRMCLIIHIHMRFFQIRLASTDYVRHGLVFPVVHTFGPFCVISIVNVGKCKKMDPGVHFECVRGSVQEIIDYRSKDSTFKEFGTRPSTAAVSNSYSQSIALAEKGEFGTLKTDYLALYLHYKLTLNSLFKFNEDKLKDVCGVWLFGPPDSGKHFSIYTLFGDSLYVKI